MFCCSLLYVHFSIAIILMGKRELIALLNLSSWCLVMVERLFLTVPRGCLQFVIVVFPDHTHLLFLTRKCQTHILQTNLWLDQEEPKNTSNAKKNRTHQSTQFSLPQQVDYKTRKDKTLLQKQASNDKLNNHWEQQQPMNKQRRNNCLRTDYRRSHWRT